MRGQESDPCRVARRGKNVLLGRLLFGRRGLFK